MAGNSWIVTFRSGGRARVGRPLMRLSTGSAFRKKSSPVWESSAGAAAERVQRRRLTHYLAASSPSPPEQPNLTRLPMSLGLPFETACDPDQSIDRCFRPTGLGLHSRRSPMASKTTLVSIWLHAETPAHQQAPGGGPHRPRCAAALQALSCCRCGSRWKASRGLAGEAACSCS
jgi:hypothetical protein